jgi:hypothetical protein
MIINSSSVGSLNIALEFAAAAQDDERHLLGLPLHERQKGSVKGIRLLKFVSVLAEEKDSLVDQFANGHSEDFAKVFARDEFLNHRRDFQISQRKVTCEKRSDLKGLLARLTRPFIDNYVVLGSEKVFVLMRIKGTL